jgi:hypothetical protein
MSEDVGRNSDTTFIVFMIVLSFAISIGITGLISLNYGFQNLNAPIDASIVNGMLTATAIVFAFVTFEAREIEPYRVKFLLLMLPVIFLMTTGGYYFSQVMDPSIGHPTKLVLVVAMANFYFNILCSINAIMIENLEDEKKEDMKRRKENLKVA